MRQDSHNFTLLTTLRIIGLIINSTIQWLFTLIHLREQHRSNFLLFLHEFTGLIYVAYNICPTSLLVSMYICIYMQHMHTVSHFGLTCLCISLIHPSWCIPLNMQHMYIIYTWFYVSMHIPDTSVLMYPLEYATHLHYFTTGFYVLCISQIHLSWCIPLYMQLLAHPLHILKDIPWMCLRNRYTTCTPSWWVNFVFIYITYDASPWYPLDTPWMCHNTYLSIHSFA